MCGGASWECRALCPEIIAASACQSTDKVSKDEHADEEERMSWSPKQEMHTTQNVQTSTVRPTARVLSLHMYMQRGDIA